MSTFTRTIHTTMNQTDTLSAAEAVAANLRASGSTVDVGQPYDDVTVRWYGMPAVDLTITEPDPPAETTETPAGPVEDAPEPMPVEEFGGSAPTTAIGAEDRAELLEAMNDSEGEPTVTDETQTSETPAPEVTPTEDNVLGNDVAAPEATPPAVEEPA